MSAPLLVLHNPSAGPEDGPGESEVRRAFAGLPDIDYAEVSGSEVEARAAGAVAEGANRIVVAGGDGTVSAAARALAGSDTELAILPLGTRNHYARDAGIPFMRTDAAALAAHGRAFGVDAARLDQRIFINNVSIGLYPDFVEDRDERHERLDQSRSRAIALAFAHTLRRRRLMHVRVRGDGAEVSRRTHVVVVGNNAYDLDGGRLTRRRHLDRGEVALYMGRVPRLSSLVVIGAKALLGQLDDDSIDRLTDSSVTIETKEPRVKVAVDGEVIERESPFEFSSMPGAINLVRPGPGVAP